MPKRTQGVKTQTQQKQKAQTKHLKPYNLSPARVKALEVLSKVRERDAYAQELITSLIDTSNLSKEDRAFATLLVRGVVSTEGTLDEVLNRALRSPNDIKSDVRDALRISTYELLMLHKEPYAVVDQGVDLVRYVQPKASRLSNAVLRKVVAQVKEFPFGDPRTDLAAFARLHAFPLWLTKLLVADMGPQNARDFMAASNEPAPIYVSANVARAIQKDVLKVLQECGAKPSLVEISGITLPNCWKLSGDRPLVHDTVQKLFSEGKLLVSDAAAQAVAHLVLPHKKPSSFLEIGAGRGTKTILIQNNALLRWGSQIEHYATLDNHAFKSNLLRQRTATYGIQVERTVTGDATNLDVVIPNEQFDAVFIDAPCSGLGTLRRHPEIRWRLKREGIDELAQTGLNMLISAASHVVVGGTLAYATCTVTHLENRQVVEAFLESEAGKGFELVPPVFSDDVSLCDASLSKPMEASSQGALVFETRLSPGSCDAHFAVVLKRIK